MVGALAMEPKEEIVQVRFTRFVSEGHQKAVRRLLDLLKPFFDECSDTSCDVCLEGFEGISITRFGSREDAEGVHTECTTTKHQIRFGVKIHYSPSGEDSDGSEGLCEAICQKHADSRFVGAMEEFWSSVDGNEAEYRLILLTVAPQGHDFVISEIGTDRAVVQVAGTIN